DFIAAKSDKNLKDGLEPSTVPSNVYSSQQVIIDDGGKSLDREIGKVRPLALLATSNILLQLDTTPNLASYALGLSSFEDTTSSPIILTPVLRPFYGLGTGQHQQTYSSVPFGEPIQANGASMKTHGIELTIPFRNNWHWRTGIALHQWQANSLFGFNGSASTIYQYSFSIPMMLEYQVSRGLLHPYIAAGVYFTNFEDLSGFSRSLSPDGYGLLQTRNTGSTFSPVIELGASFRLFKQTFSIAIMHNFSTTKVIDNDYFSVSNGESFGESTVAGKYTAMKIKYHFPVFKKMSTRLSNKVHQQIEYQNNVGVDIGGVAGVYSIYYERLFGKREWIKFGIKPGLSYVPEYEERGFVSGPADDVKLMGLLVPLTFSAYIGQRGRYLQIGLNNTLLYGPWRYPEQNPGNYGFATNQAAILGLRAEFKRWIFGGQAMMFFNLMDREEGIAPYAGLTLGRAF
ncbi:MAG: hypothetical protein AAFO07_26100, partial [Bacteroidota bacterium]